MGLGLDLLGGGQIWTNSESGGMDMMAEFTTIIVGGLDLLVRKIWSNSQGGIHI